MSHFKAKMHQILYPASVRSFVRVKLRLYISDGRTGVSSTEFDTITDCVMERILLSCAKVTKRIPPGRGDGWHTACVL